MIFDEEDYALLVETAAEQDDWVGDSYQRTRPTAYRLPGLLGQHANDPFARRPGLLGRAGNLTRASLFGKELTVYVFLPAGRTRLTQFQVTFSVARKVLEEAGVNASIAVVEAFMERHGISLSNFDEPEIVRNVDRSRSLYGGRSGWAYVVHVSKVVLHAAYGFSEHAERIIAEGVPAIHDGEVTDNFKYVVERAIRELPDELRAEARALLSPQSLALMAGFAAAGLALGSTGVGAVVMTGAGAVMVGAEAAQALTDFKDFVLHTGMAKQPSEFERAVAALKRCVVRVGVAGVLEILTRGMVKRGKSHGTGGGGGGGGTSGGGGKVSTPAVPPRSSSAPASPKSASSSSTGAGTPRGKPTKINPNEKDAGNIRALKRENESAQALAKSGYDVEQNPFVAGTKKNPDYKINGQVFDCYAPSTGNARNIAKVLQEKLEDGQSERFVLNLDDSAVSIDALRKQLTDYPVPGVKEVIIVKDGKATPFFPF